MNRTTAYAVVVLFVVDLMLAGAGLLWVAHEVNASQHRWCATLTLLTARPVPRPTNPEANPSRENAWIFYRNLTELRQRFGC